MKKIPKDTLDNICKMGQGPDCCRYIIVDPDHGIVCAKFTVWEAVINEKAKGMNAQGDNCEGILFEEGSKAIQENN